MSHQNLYIPKIPEIRTYPFRVQSQEFPPSSYVPQEEEPMPFRESPLRLIASGVPPPVPGRYQPSATPQSVSKSSGQPPVRTYDGVATTPPPTSSSYRETTSPNRNFLTVQPNRSLSRTPLTLNSGSPIPSTTNRSLPASPLPSAHSPIIYRNYSSSPSPFGTARRAPPVLDRYPAVLSLNEVKLTPQSKRPERHSDSSVPSVLARYPPKIEYQYARPTNWNSEPLPPTKSLKKSKKQTQSTTDNNYVPNRFRYPPSPPWTSTRFFPSPSPWTEVSSSSQPSPTSGTPTPPSLPEMKKGPGRHPPITPDMRMTPPPPSPPEMKKSPVPPPPKRNPTKNNNDTLFVRKPSLKVKRSPSTGSMTNQNGRLIILPAAPIVTKGKGGPPNHSSKLLSPDENEIVFEVLGEGRRSLSTAIVEILLPSEDELKWGLQEVAVLCFVRDPKKKSYFLEFLSLSIGRCIYSCEIYEEFHYKAVKELKFLTFEGHDSTVGVSFADSGEFQDFKDTLNQKIEAKRQRRHDRQSKAFEANTLPSSTDHILHSEPTVVQTKESKKSKSIFSRKFSNSRSKREKKWKKLNKKDIGRPLNFHHVSHAGFDPQHGFQSYGDLDEKYKDIFDKAEISAKELNDPDTRKFIYQFVENYEKESESNSTTFVTPPPPPMDIHLTSQASSYYTPPSQRSDPNISNGFGNTYQTQHHKAPPPPPSRLTKQAKIPPPPPLPTGQVWSNSYGPSPPPPPPPPMPIEQSPIMEQKRHFPNPSIPEVDNVRSNLLKEIQEAAKGKLKPVNATTATSSPPLPKSMDSLVGALQRALADRSQAINPDSSESEDEDSYTSDEWEEE